MNELTVGKCKVLCVGRDNPRNRYTINNEALISLEYEKDLGVRVSSDLSLRKQCTDPRNEPNGVLGFILGVKNKSLKVIFKLYLTLVRLTAFTLCGTVLISTL